MYLDARIYICMRSYLHLSVCMYECFCVDRYHCMCSHKLYVSAGDAGGGRAQLPYFLPVGLAGRDRLAAHAQPSTKVCVRVCV